MNYLNQSIKDHKYWLLIGLFFLILIIFLYPYTTFEGMKINITRNQAIESARSFLIKQNINLDGYFTEGYLLETFSQTDYLLKKLGPGDFKEVINEGKLPVYGWNIRFYKNISQGESQTLYTVNLSYSGKIIGYRKTIPDTASLPSVTIENAKKIIENYIEKNSSIHIKDFNLIESNVNNFSNRKDYSFTWKKELPEIKCKLKVTASIQGNQPGSFLYALEIPPGETIFLETDQIFMITVSIIFVFFLTQFAIFLFLKKYHEGEVWINIGKSLFLILFSALWIELINSWPSVGQSFIIGNLNPLMIKIIIFASTGFLVYFFLSLLVFSCWTVGESYTREFWPEKLRGIDAFIKGKMFTIPSGFSLMRGMIIGIAVSLFYIVLIILLNRENSSIFVSGYHFLNIYSGLSPAVDLIVGAFTSTILSSIPLNFFIISITYNKWKMKWLSIFFCGILSAAGSIIAINNLPINYISINLLFAFLVGCFSGYLFFKYDLLTLLSVHYHVFLIINSLILFAGNTNYYMWNSVIVVIGACFVPVIYFISRKKMQDFELESLGMPAHILKISERERLKKEMEIAAKVQLSLLPKEEPKLLEYEIASISIPAKEAGGDYYDFVKLDNQRLGIAVGDVSGKGVGAAIYMTLTKGIFQAHAEEEAMPKYVLAKVNKLLYKTIEKNSFVSMIYAILDTQNHTLTYSRAGHNPGILVSSDHCRTELLRSNGIALGLDQGYLFNKVLVEDQISIKNNDLIVFYTDGFTEAMNENLEEYGEERLTNIILDNRKKSPKEILNLVLKDIKKFIDVYPQHDDMTIVILKRD